MSSRARDHFLPVDEKGTTEHNAKKIYERTETNDTVHRLAIKLKTCPIKTHKNP